MLDRFGDGRFPYGAGSIEETLDVLPQQFAARCRRVRRSWRLGPESLADNFQGFAAPQFSAFLWRPAHFANRHVDANDCTIVAGLPHDGVLVAVRKSWVLRAVSCIPAGSAGRNVGRPRGSAPCRNRHTGLVHDFGACTGGADAFAFCPGVASICAERIARRCERLRHSSATVLPERYGGQGRPDERDRVELVNVQRRENRGPGCSWISRRENWGRLVLLQQWRQLYCRDHRIALDESTVQSSRWRAFTVGIAA